MMASRICAPALMAMTEPHAVLCLVLSVLLSRNDIVTTATITETIVRIVGRAFTARRARALMFIGYKGMRYCATP